MTPWGRFVSGSKYASFRFAARQVNGEANGRVINMEPWICSIRPENFHDEVMAEEKPLLIGCLAQDDSYDRQLGILENVARAYRTKLKVGLLAQDTMEICKRKLHVAGSPTFVLMKDGKEIGRILGISDQVMLENFVELRLPVCPAEQAEKK